MRSARAVAAASIAAGGAQRDELGYFGLLERRDLGDGKLKKR